MRKYSNLFFNVILAVGVLCASLGLFFIINIISSHTIKITVSNVLFIFGGAFLFYLSLVRFKSSILFFLGLFIFFSGCFFALITSEAFPDGLGRFWPFSLFICSLCLFFTGFSRYRKIKNSYFYPSLLICALGVFFLLFSLDIIKISFSAFFSIAWPFLLFIVGAFLVIVFGIQQNPAFHFNFQNEIEESKEDDPAAVGLSDEGEAKR